MEHSLAAVSILAVAWDSVLVLLLPFPVVVAANWHESPPGGDDSLSNAARLFGTAIWALLAMVSASCVVLGLLTLLGAVSQPRATGAAGLEAYGTVLVITGLVAASVLSRSTRTFLAHLLPIDASSALDATGLVLSMVLVGSQVASQLGGDLLTQQATSGVALGPLDLVTQEAPFLVAAFLGVGLFIRRSPREALVRLGLVRPTGWQLVMALGAAGLFYAFGNGVDALGHMVTPGLANKIDAANQRLFGHLDDPAGIATIALSAGLCEEALFRGALQPRLGVLWTSIVFAAVHTQYGLSLDTIAVLILAIGLGLLRRIANTTTTTACHVVYNTLVGVGIGGAWLVPALAVEAALVLAGLTAFLTGKLGSLRPAQ